MSARRPRPMHVRLRAGAVAAAVVSVLLGTVLPLVAPAVLAAFASGAVTFIDVGVLGCLALLALLAGLGLSSALPATGTSGLAWELAMFTRLPRLSGLVYLASSLAVLAAVALVAPVLVLAGPLGAAAAGLCLGLCAALGALAVGTLLPLDWEPVPDAQPVPVDDDGTTPESPLLKFIRESTPYRWQVSDVALLRGASPVLATPDECAVFEARWPGALAMLAAAGAPWPTPGHLAGVNAVLEASEAALVGGPVAQRPDGAVALTGLPGSGRTQAVLAAAAWVSEIRGGRVLVVVPTGEDVVPGWVHALVSRDGQNPELLWRVPPGPAGQVLPGAAPAVIVAEGQSLVEGLLPALARAQPEWAWGLRLVVVLHPHRFPRAEWLHVREGLVRLRTLVGSRGHDFASVVVMHAADNALSLAEHLLARADTTPVKLERAAPPQLLVGWLPPTMLSPVDDRYIVRTPLHEELAVLLASIGAAGFCGVFGARVRPRVLISDPTGLLSPEARVLLRSEVEDVAKEWAVLFKSAPVDLVPELVLTRGFAPVSLDPSFRVVVHAGPGPTAWAEVEALRGYLEPGGTLFMVAAPRAHDVEAVGSVERAASPPAMVMYPPGLSDDLVRARLWQFLEHLKPGTCLTGSSMATTHGGESWTAFLDAAGTHGLGDCVRRGIVRDPSSGVVLADRYFVAPEAWPRAAAAPMPWSCVTSQRLDVHSENATHAEVGEAAQIDAERGLVDWAATMLTEGDGHSLRVTSLSGGAVDVYTPEASEAAAPVLYRTVRTLEWVRDGVERTRVMAVAPGLRCSFARRQVELRETVSALFRTAHGLNADRRLVGEPTEVPPYVHALVAAALSVDVQSEEATLSPEASRALLNAWRLDLESACLWFGREVDAEDAEIEGGRRWLFFRRFSSQEWTPLTALEPSSTDELRAILARAGRRLRECHCLDGCVLCCARLGDVPVALTVARGGRPDPDIDPAAVGHRVSRTAAVAWLVTVKILPDLPAWPGDDRDLARLERLRRRVLGEPPNWNGGWVGKMLGSMQHIPEGRVAPIDWMSPDECTTKTSAGYYMSGPEHVVRVRPAEDDDWVAEVIVHEYAHNWQWEGGRFDAGLHRTGPPGNAYYSGKLVIEGHATWVESQFRMSVGRQPTFRADDGAQWTEYKAGYLVVDWIARTYGVAALYTWLAGHKDPRPTLRVGNAPWPLRLDDAIDRAGVRSQIVGPGGDSDVL